MARKKKSHRRPKGPRFIARSRTVARLPEYQRWAGSQAASVSANVMTLDLPRTSLVILDTADLPVTAKISHTAGADT